jgi:hypothetical protein
VQVDRLLTLSTVLIVTIAGVVRYTQWRARQRAREALVAFAVANGWTYSPSDYSLVNRWFLPPFGKGEERTATHVIRGRRDDRDFVAFEYRFVEIRTDSKGRRRRRTSTFSIVAAALPGWLPIVTVVPETMADRALRAAGIGLDVELESEDFNRAYVITGDARTASDLLTPRAMERLMALPRFAFRAEGSDLVGWQSGPMGPTDLLARLAALDAVIDSAPGFLWADHRRRSMGSSDGPESVGGSSA